MSKISITLPESGLSPNISLLNSSTLVVDFSGVMTEKLTTKSYWYEFTEAVGVDYIFTITAPGINITDVLFAESSSGGGGGFTTEDHERLFALPTSVGGGGINITGIYNSISNASKNVVEEMKKEHETTREKIETVNNDTKSHIDIAKGEITDSIEAIEIPDMDLSTINSSLGVVKTQLTKAISGKDKEKAELAREYEKRLKDKDKEIEELEETYKEMESSTEEQINEKVSEKEELIQELEETAQELMDEYEKENINAKELVIEKIKQSL